MARTTTHARWLGLALPLVILGCQSIGDDDPVDGTTISLGTALTGEACEARPEPTGQGISEAFAVHCVGWKNASGEVIAVDTGQTAAQWAAASPWRRDLADVAACAPGRPESQIFEGQTIFFECSLNTGGWPYVAIVRSTGDRILAARGVPTAAPALARLMDVAAIPPEQPSALQRLLGAEPQPRPVTTTPAATAEIRRIEAFVARRGGLASVRDIAAVEQLIRLGYRYSEAREWQKASEAHQQALAIQRQVLGPNHPAVGRMMSSVAQQLSVLGQKAQAEKLFAEADEIIRKAPETIPLHLSGLAYHEAGTGELDRAIALMKQTGSASAGVGLSSVATRQISLPEIDFQLRQGLVDEAKANALAAVSQLDGATGAGAYWLAEAKQRLARVQQAEGRFGDATATWTEVLGLRKMMFGDGPAVAATYRDLGYASYQQGLLPEAFQFYSDSLNMLGERAGLRGRLRPDDLGSAMAVGLELARRDPAGATAITAAMFEFGQLPSGSTTSKAINQMAVRLATEDPRIAELTRELQEVEAARSRIAAMLGVKLAELDDTPSSDDCQPGGRLSSCSPDQLRAFITAAEERYASLELNLQAAHPGYAGLVAAPPVPAADLRAIMAPGEVLVHILPTSWNTTVFLVRGGNVRVLTIDMSLQEFEQLVEHLRLGLDWGRHGQGDFDVATAHGLYKALFGPFEKELATARHLVVIGSGPVLSLPPGVLVTQQPPLGPADYRDVAWLAKDVSISLLPSVRAFYDLRAVAKPSAAPQPFIGFADPAFDGRPGDAQAVDAVAAACRDGAASAADVRSLPRLPETTDELAAIADSLGAGLGSVIRGADATEERVQQTDLSQYRVVAFATHGLLPGELACQAEPALAFTPSGNDDGLLDASDVLSLDLDADWVLLSACNTAGSNGQSGGESLSGLAQAFFFAGARSLLVSHWAVASEPTTEFTTAALDRFANSGMTKAEALRTSQMAMIADAELSHPFFWAPFSLIGDGGQRSL